MSLTPQNIMPLSLLRKSFQNLIRDKPQNRNQEKQPTYTSVLSDRPAFDKNQVLNMLSTLNFQKGQSSLHQQTSWRPMEIKRGSSSSAHLKSNIQIISKNENINHITTKQLIHEINKQFKILTQILDSIQNYDINTSYISYK